MIYLDASVALAHLLVEPRRPPELLWSRDLVASSQLLTFELHVALHRRGRWTDQRRHALGLLDQLGLLPLTDDVLERARTPFPIPVRTLDALHLATACYLREQGERVTIATYDSRFATAAQALDFTLETL